MGEYGKRAKPAAAGRRAAPASYTRGNARPCLSYAQYCPVGGNARPTCPTSPTSPTCPTCLTSLTSLTLRRAL
ncbi:MAG: hypothetical protein IKA65_00570, partial [Lentisphaeria bacterium]|nr:hypothetical protein [Lentisphaeria bacterium]